MKLRIALIALILLCWLAVVKGQQPPQREMTGYLSTGPNGDHPLRLRNGSVEIQLWMEPAFYAKAAKASEHIIKLVGKRVHVTYKECTDWLGTRMKPFLVIVDIEAVKGESNDPAGLRREPAGLLRVSLQPIILDREEPAKEVTWPDIPDGFKYFDKTRRSQAPSIMTYEGGMYPTWSAGHIGPGNRHLNLAMEPTRVFSADGTVPWLASGGLHGLRGWRSDAYVKLPKDGKITFWSERIDGGAIEKLPVNRWEFPPGTVFADVLSTDSGVFEVRTRTKFKGGWREKVAFKAEGNVPNGYAGAGKSCIECHARAGEWQSYGTMAPGSDTVFSFPVFVEGTRRLNPDWPIVHWGDE